MLNANNSYMHKHYIRFDTNDAIACIQYYYEKLDVTVETLEHLIMQFVGMPLPIIRSRATTRNLLNIPWVFKTWDDAFAYYRSKHFQEPNERHAVTPFLTGAIEAYIVNKFDVKQQIYTRTQEFNLVNIEELIMTNKKEDVNVKEELVEMLHTGSGNRDIALGILAMPDSDKTLNKPSKETTSVSDGIGAVSETQNEFNDNTILNIDNLSKWVVSTLELSTNKSILVNRIVDHAKERELIGKQAYLFMFELANGFFTYSFKNLRHAEANFKKLKDTAQKFVKANPPKQMTTAEYMDDIEKQVRGSNVSLPVTQTDLIEETTMSATKPTQAEIYQSITKDPITVESVRKFIRKLFADSQNREPREAIIDRFMESIDLSVHDNWLSLVNFILSDKYNPNRARLPFGDIIFTKFHVHLKNLVSAGTFDFSDKDTANKEDTKPTAIDNVDSEKEEVSAIAPKVDTESNATLNLLRGQLECLFMRYEFEGNLIQVLADEISDLVYGGEVGSRSIIPVVNDIEVPFSSQENREIFSDVFALQLIAFYLLHSHEVFKNKDNADYTYAILKYVDKVIRDLNVRTNHGKWFANNNVSMHLNILPNFKHTEGDTIRASYLIAAGLLTPERSNEILSVKQEPILMDLTKVPVEYFPLPTDNINTDSLAVGIIQIMINLFTTEEKDVNKNDPEFNIDVSKPLSGPEASYLNQEALDKVDEPNTSVPTMYEDAVTRMFGIAVGPNKFKGVFNNMDGDFIQQMAVHLADHNVDILHQFKAYPKSWWAFLAIETYFTYMVKNLDVKLPLPILGGFIYTFNTFMHTGIFTEKTELASLSGRNYNTMKKANTPEEIAEFVADFMGDKSAAEYMTWYKTNADTIKLPRSDNEFVSMFSDKFLNDRNYAIYVLACLMTRTINNLTAKPQEETNVTDTKQSIMIMLNNTPCIKPEWRRPINDALVSLATEVNLTPMYVNLNPIFLTKVGLTMALINGTIQHHHSIGLELAQVYDLRDAVRVESMDITTYTIIALLANISNTNLNILTEAYLEKHIANASAAAILLLPEVSKSALASLTVRNNALCTQLQSTTMYPHYTSQPNISGMYQADTSAKQRNFTTPSVGQNAYNPQPAMYPQHNISSQFDGPRPQPFTYPNAQSYGMQPGMNPNAFIGQHAMYPNGRSSQVMHPGYAHGAPIQRQWSADPLRLNPMMYPQADMSYAAGSSDAVDVDTVEVLQDLQDEIDKLETVQSITAEKLTELRERMADIIRDL